MAETLTIVRLGVPPTLARTLRPANPIESMIEICREHSKNVKVRRESAGSSSGGERPAPSARRSGPGKLRAA